MKKGITPVIATILLLLITISMIGTAFTFFSTTASQTAIAAENSSKNLMNTAGSFFTIDSIYENKVYIRNRGSNAISNFDVFIGDTKIDSDNPTILPGQVGMLTLNSSQLPSGTAYIKVLGQGGFSDKIQATFHGTASCGDNFCNAWETCTGCQADCGACPGDTTPPIISGVASSGISSSAATITWTTDENSDSQVEYGTTIAYGSSTTLDAALVTSHLVMLTGLASGTLYHYRVKSRDGSGTLSTSADLTFTTDNSGSVSITVTITSPTWGSTYFTSAYTVALAGTASDTIDVTQVTWINERGGTGTATGTTNWLANAIPLLSGANLISVTSHDALGNTATDTLTVTLDSSASPPVLYLPFDEATGSVATDASGNGNNGTLVNAPLWTTGKVGGALALNGVDQYVQVGNSASLNSIVSGVTVAAWVFRYADQTYWVHLVSREIGTTWSEWFGFGFLWNKFAWKVNTGASGNPASSPNVGGVAPIGEWIHMAGTYDGSFAKLYVNGVQEFSTPYSGTFAPETNPLIISGNDDHSASIVEHLNGRLDDLRIYNRALSADEIQAIYQNQPPAPADITPPLISNVGGSGISSTGATISWTTNENSDSQVDYGTTVAYGNSTTLNSNMVTGHSQSVSGLSPSTVYHYRVKSRDAVGNLATSGDYTFTTTAVPDTTPPIRSNGFPTGILAAGTPSTAISLSTNEAATCKYSTSLGVAYAAMTTTFSTTGGTSHSTTVTGLVNGQAYNYYVRCQDGTGNANADDFTISFSVASGGGAPWYNPSWQYRKSITINEAQIVGSHSNFPLLISLNSDSNLASSAQATGNDILFTDSSETKLDHEIESYTSSTGKLAAWVRIPSISATAGQTIYMYYGNAAAADQQNKAGVWDSYYKGVWHLGEGDSTSSGFYKDSTSYGRNGTLTDANSNSAQGTGKIGNAMNFAGDADYIDAGAGTLSITNQLTAEAWAYSDIDSNRRLVSKHGSPYGWMLARAVDTDAVEWTTSTTGSDWDGGNSATNSFEVSTWKHIVGTYDGSNMRVFINGVESSGSFPYPQTGNVFNSPGSVQIARDGYSGDSGVFDGVLDEVRISATNRSAQWIQTEFNNMNSPSAFYTVGTQTVSNPTGDTTPPTVSITSPASGATVSGTTAVSATASDSVGVAGVQFKLDGINLGAEDTSSPYSISWDTTTASNGAHILTAVARDANGNSATSAPVSVTVSTSTGPLRVLSSNPRYFTDGSGKAIYLTGSHTWWTLKDMGASDPPPAFDYTGFLNFLQQRNHNFFRMWTWDLTKYTCGSDISDISYAAPWPWMRTGPGAALDGKLKFDFNNFNQSYFDRLRARAIEAGNRGIYTSIMLFEGYGDQFCENGLGGSPFNGSNNINSINAAPTVPYTLSNPAVTTVQEAYVRKIIDTVNDLDNVMYEIANEAGSYSVSWQYHMINFVKNYEASKPKQHPVGMTFPHSGGSMSDLFSSQADWISPSDAGGYNINPPVNDGSKVILSDTDHIWGMGGDRHWVWKSFLRGLNPIYMDDLVSATFTVSWEGITYDANSARLAMGYTLTYANKMNLAAMVPRGDLTSTTYALANPGLEYLVYQPTSDSFTVNLVAGTYSYEWFNPSTGSVAQSGTITASSGINSFSPPFSGDAVLYLKK